MTSSKPDTPNGAEAFDPEAVLMSDAGLLLNEHFATALYAELCRARGAEAAHTALLQIACLHGLRDAKRVLGTTFHAPSTLATVPSAPALAVQLRARPGGDPSGALEISGCWPERIEAKAHQGRADEPACVVSAGYTSGWLSGVLETDLVVVESRCAAAGDTACTFVARQSESWREDDDARGRAAAEALPLSDLRGMLAALTPPAEEPDEDSGPVVHVWGSVMIVPFAGTDEVLTAVDMLHNDPTLAEVSVIVIDLSKQAGDETFAEPALGRIVESIDAAGAESVFAGVSLLIEPVLARLEPAPMLVCADLDSAIAASFQIAESQRRPV